MFHVEACIMKKHYVLKNKKRFFSLVTALAIVISTVFFASSVYGYEGRQYETITVKSGDTLWTIAQKYNKSGDIRKLIHAIKKANNLEASSIYAGEQLLVPRM